jgi:hypothetical protein
MTKKNSFKETGPHIFQEGDIVELQISFIVVPLRDQQSRMNIVLRSISLLEGKFTQVSESTFTEYYILKWRTGLVFEGPVRVTEK